MSKPNLQHSRFRKLACAISLSALLAPGCAASFPSGDLESNVLSAIALLQGFGMTPSALTHVAAGATYQFRLTGGGGSAGFRVDGCGGSIDGAGLFTAAAEDAVCTVTGVSPTLSTRTLVFPVRTYAGLIKSHGSGLHAYFPLDADAGDASGNGNNGGIVGGATPTGGGALKSTVYKSNKYLQLDGTSQYVNNIPAFDPQAAAASGQTGFSAEIWFRVTDVNALVKNTAIPLISQVGCGTGTARVWLGIDTDNMDQVSTNLGGTYTRAGTTVEGSRWYHAAVTVRGTVLKLYMNGLMRKQASISAEQCSGPAGTFQIGFFTGVLMFPGEVDEAAIYKTELSAGDVAAHYLAGLAKTVAFDDLSTYAAYGNPKVVTAFGGQTPFTYASASTLAAGSDSLDATSGLYTAPTISASAQVSATKTVKVTDAHGNVATQDLTVFAFPISFPTLTAWYTAEVLTNRFDTGTPAERQVPALFDLSSNGIVLFASGLPPEFVRPSTAALPLLDKPAINFNTFAPLISSTGYDTYGDLTAFVLAYRPAAGNGVLLSFDGPAAGLMPSDVLFQFGLAGPGGLAYSHELATATQPMVGGAGPVPAGTAWHLMGFQRYGGGTNLTLYLDGTQTARTIAAGDGSGATNSLLRLGGANDVIIPGAAGTWPGPIAEAVIFYRALSATEVEQVQCYFKVKYSLGFFLPTYCP